MTNSGEPTIAQPGIKILTAWLAAIGIASWSDLAAALAALYSAILILEWLWKKLIRPALERKGLLQRQYRRKGDA